MKIAESSPKEQKTLWEKEKLLVTSKLCFSQSVFKRLVLQTRKNQGLFGKVLRSQADVWGEIWCWFQELESRENEICISCKKFLYQSMKNKYIKKQNLLKDEMNIESQHDEETKSYQSVSQTIKHQ